MILLTSYYKPNQASRLHFTHNNDNIVSPLHTRLAATKLLLQSCHLKSREVPCAPLYLPSVFNDAIKILAPVTHEVSYGTLQRIPHTSLYMSLAPSTRPSPTSWCREYLGFASDWKLCNSGLWLEPSVDRCHITTWQWHETKDPLSPNRRKKEGEKRELKKIWSFLFRIPLAQKFKKKNNNDQRLEKKNG